jgi:DNA polymerase-3 subunit delta
LIHVLHGEDEFSITEALARIRASVGPEEVRDANTTVFEGRGFQIGAVVAAASAVPFLAERRLVIVRGLLSRLQEGDKKPSFPPAADPLPAGRGTRDSGSQGEGEAPSPPKSSEIVSRSPGDEWDALASRLEGIPATTELVFFDVPENDRQKLKRGGRGLRVAGPRAVVKEFEPPQRQALDAWTRDRFAALGAQAGPDAVARLTWLAGGNLRLLDQEVRKLALHADGRPVRREDMDLLVPEAREESIFAAVDAILERRPGVAMKLLYNLLSGGATSGYVLNMLSRQVRNVILAQDLRDRSVPPDEIGKRTGVKKGFALDKTLRQAERFSPAYLASVHRRLLDADLSIKTGELDERLAIEILVARLSAA